MRLLPLDPVRRTAVLLAFLTVAGLYFVHTYAYSPGTDRLRELESRLLDRDPQTSQDDVVARSPEQLQRYLAGYGDLVEELEALIPASDQVPALLETIANEERRAGIEMTMLRPDPPEPGEHYERRSYELAVRGGYHAIGSFLTAIGSLEYIVATDNMIVAAEATPPGDRSAEPVTVVASFRIRLWVVGPRSSERPDPIDRM